MKTVIELVQIAAKDVADSKPNLPKLKENLAEIYEKMYEVRIETTRLANENLDLRESLEYRGKLEFAHNVFWEKNEGGSRVGSPVCPNCWQGEAKRVVRMIDYHHDGSYYQCPVCGKMVEVNHRQQVDL